MINNKGDKMKGINYKNAMALLLVGGVMLTTTNYSTIWASDETSYISESRYTESKLYKGDSFEIELDFVPTKAITKIESVEVNGEAVDVKDYSYDLLVPSTGEYKEGSIGIGEITTIDINNLVYTGKGDTVEVVIRHSGGVLKQKITLNTITTDNVKGALVLDPNVSSNMSASMQAGESKKLSLTIKNTSDETIKNSTVKVGLTKTTVGLAIKDGQYTEISSLAEGESKTISFEVEVGDEVKADTYEIQVEINGIKQNVLLEVENDDESAVIEMKYPETTKFIAGSANKLDLTLANSGSEGAYNVKIYLQSKEGVGLVGSSSVISVGDLEAKSSKKVPISVQLDDSKEGQLVNVPFKITYTTKSGEKVEELQEVYLDVKDDATKEAEVSISGVKVSKASVGEGGTFNVSFNVVADALAEDIKVGVKMPEGILATSQNTFMIDTLAGGKAKSFTVSCIATDKASEGYQPIELTAEYEYEDAKAQISQYTGVNSLVTQEEDEEEEENITEAKVIIGGYDITPGILTAGEEGTLVIKLTNTHATEVVRNLTATYTTEGQEQVISPVGSGNTLFTNQILPGQTVVQTLKFKISNNAEVKDYQINVGLNYETEDIQKVEAVQTINLPISEQGAIQVGAIEGVSLSTGKATPLTIPLYNRGNADVSNVMVYLEGEGFETKDNELYISSFATGSTEYYLPTITPNSDKVDVKLIIECEGAEGIIERIEYPLNLVSSSKETSDGANGGREFGMGKADGNTKPGMQDMTPEERKAIMMGQKSEQSKKSMPVWVMGIVAAVLAAGSFVGYKLLNKRKKLKGQDEYENL